MPNCSISTTPEFLQSEFFLQTSMYLITTFGLPIHIFGAYCILLKTPERMSDMKWAMLNLHLWSSGYDISLGYLLIPFLMYPATAGTSLGVLTDLGCPLPFQIVIGAAVLASVIVSVTCLFETRYFYLYAENSNWRLFRKPWLLVNYLLAFTYSIPTCLMIPEQLEAKLYFKTAIPCLSDFLFDDRVLVLSVHNMEIATNVALVVFPIQLQSFLFIILIYRNMKNLETLSKLSKKTLDLQRKFLKALILQVTIPVAIVSGPMIYNGYAGITIHYNQGFNNVATLVMSIHGTVSTVVMILVQKPYREVVMRCLKVSRAQTKIRNVSNVTLT